MPLRIQLAGFAAADCADQLEELAPRVNCAASRLAWMPMRC
jgi:hypothetical protein